MDRPPRPLRVSRRRLLAAGGAAALASALDPYAPLLDRAVAAGLRQPDSLPDPTRPAGEPTDALPFDHVVVVMMENHSFDTYLGMLPARGQPLADGFRFAAGGRPLNSNPYRGGYISVQRAPSLCQPDDAASQSWNDTHREVDGGRMDGFANLGRGSMCFWDEPDLPFYYSLAKTFCLANRWFCSAPCQTYPNRRFLMAGTAFGLISTDTSSVTQYPPNGTIFDRLSAHGVSWRDYYTDVPTTAIIFPTVTRYPANHLPISQFYADCAAGTLPAVSFVDSDIGATAVVGGNVVGAVPVPLFQGAGQYLSTGDGDEENPGDISLGENFVSSVVGAVLRSPAFERTLLVWCYDEHGGYYDHVPPPAAVPPDAIRPVLASADVPGAYDVLGPRVPAVVVGGHARANAVSNTVVDHTSILATIEAKWNLPALTLRDANANTLASFLDLEKPTFSEPPTLAAPSNPIASQAACTTATPQFAIHSSPPGPSAVRGPRPARRRLSVRFRGRHRHPRGVLVELRAAAGAFDGITVELRHGGRRVAEGHAVHVGAREVRVVLHGIPPAGRYTLVVRHRSAVLVRRRVTLG